MKFKRQKDGPARKESGADINPNLDVSTGNLYTVSSCWLINQF
jgi:hypothetical protein